MTEYSKTESANNELIIEKLNALESRIKRIELRLRHVSPGSLYENEDGEEFEEIKIKKPEGSVIESNLVEYGLSWLSTIVFVFGIIFLMSYIRINSSPILASITGYAAAAGLFIFTHLLRNSLSHIIKFLNTCGLLLVYIVTIRLHFFSPEPVIDSTGISLALLSISLGFFVWYTIKSKSELLAFFSILLVLTSAIISDSTYITLSFITISAKRHVLPGKFTG